MKNLSRFRFLTVCCLGFTLLGGSLANAYPLNITYHMAGHFGEFHVDVDGSTTVQTLKVDVATHLDVHADDVHLSWRLAVPGTALHALTHGTLSSNGIKKEKAVDVLANIAH